MNNEMDNYLDQTFWNHTVSRPEHRILGRYHRGGADCHFDEYCVLENETEGGCVGVTIRREKRLNDQDVKVF
jgi:hypothetical protein